MKLPERLKEPARAIAVIAGLAAAGCAPELSKADCAEFGAKPAEGACLRDRYSDVNALRTECNGMVETVLRQCECGRRSVLVWQCAEVEPGFGDSDFPLLNPGPL